MTAWERSIARRTLVSALAAFALALLVTAASDEGGVSWAERLARTLPAAPLLAAAATGLVAQHARARGEHRALASLGASPWSVARGAVAGAAVFALVAALLTALVPGAAATFFPRAPFVAHFAVAAGAAPHAFVDPGSGWTVLADGALVRDASGFASAGAAATAGATRGLPSGAVAAAATALAAAGIGLSLLVAAALADPPSRSRRSRRAWIAHVGRPVALAAMVLFAFQRAAATGHGAVVPAALALLYLVDGARRFRKLARA